MNNFKGHLNDGLQLKIYIVMIILMELYSNQTSNSYGRNHVQLGA